jgi:molybdopterin-containing oxidoreductase family iron-sulfur binding subunit
MKKEIDRRDFLKIGGLSSVGAAGLGFPLLSAVVRAAGGGHSSDAPASKQLAMVIDIQKCLNEKVRSACAAACHREHNVPEISDPEEEVKWLWSEDYDNAFPDQVHPRAANSGKPVLVLCNHCTNPACVKVCPTRATLKRKSDGVVMMDMHRCIGCRYCMAACPYGARSFNWRDPRPHIKGEIRKEYPVRAKGVVEKCTFCAKRIRKGLAPACVDVANQIPEGQGALTFGDASDSNSEVSRILREKHTICRRASIGTAPNVYYIV